MRRAKRKEIKKKTDLILEETSILPKKPSFITGISQ
jgi:hypothetical protein